MSKNNLECRCEEKPLAIVVYKTRKQGYFLLEEEVFFQAAHEGIQFQFPAQKKSKGHENVRKMSDKPLTSCRTDEGKICLRIF